MFRKFGPNDIIRNTLVAHPKSNFIINESRVFYNYKPVQSGSFGAFRRAWWQAGRDMDDRGAVARPPLRPDGPLGMVNLYEFNIDRAGPQVYGDPSPNPYMYPVLTKNSSYTSFKTVLEATEADYVEYNNEFNWGDEITGSYPMTASIRRDFITSPSTFTGDGEIVSYNDYFVSLKNLLNLYGVRSRHYLVTSSYGDKNQQKLNLIHIPSIFYGHQIRPGSLSLKWYYSGSLIGELRDTKQNGELIQVSGTYDDAPMGSETHGAKIGNVAGVALYDEGLLLMTGSWELSNTTMHLKAGGGGSKPQWITWGAGTFDGVNEGTVNGGAGSATFRNATFELSFEGTTRTQALTMYAHAKKGEVNYSNNPTFIKHGQKQLEQTSSHVYEENSSRKTKNIVSSSYSNFSASYQRQVYISKIAVYDEAKNLIGIATLANPILKEEEQDYTFKIKLDI